MLRRRVTEKLLFAACALLCGASAGTLPAAEATNGTVRNDWICPNTPMATPYYVIDSGRTGPVVMVVGGVHGNEMGWAAAQQIRAWNVARGKLIVLPEANRAAVLAQKRGRPVASGEPAEDLNRNFPTATNPVPRGALAAAIWELVGRTKPDWLLDLHEGLRPGGATTGSVGNSVIAIRDPATEAAARAMIEEVNASLPADAAKFRMRQQPISGSLARAAADRLGVKSMILETAKADQNVFVRTAQLRRMVWRFLRERGMAANGPEVMVRKDPAVIAVAIYDDVGSHAGGLEHVLGPAANLAAHRVGSAEIDAGILDQFDVLLVPGGSGTEQAREVGPVGRDAVRKFVQGGGGYVGTCAGAYFASLGHHHSLGILNASIADVNRGKAKVRVDLSAQGRNILGLRAPAAEIFYHNGPVWGPGDKDTAACEVLATFRTEVTSTNSTPRVKMEGTPAILCGRYGKGRVICSSPHPEATDGMEESFRRMVRWAAGRQNLGRDEPTKERQ